MTDFYNPGSAENDAEEFYTPFGDGVGNGKKHKLAEKHLSSPIVQTLLVRVHNDLIEALETTKSKESRKLIAYVSGKLDSNPGLNTSGYLPAFKRYLATVLKCGKVPHILQASEYPGLFNIKTSVKSGVAFDHKAARKVYKKQLQAYMDYVGGALSEEEREKLREQLAIPKRLSSDLLGMGSKMQFWSTVVDKWRLVKQQRDVKFMMIDGHRFWFSSDFMVFQLSFESWPHIATYEQAQMIQDATLSRFNTYHQLELGLHNGTDKLKLYVPRLLSWMDRLLVQMGNPGYEILKSPEALFKTWVTSLVDGEILSHSSFDRTVEKIRVKEKKLSGKHVFTDELAQLCRTVDSVNDAVELSGLIKLSGHPTVYASKSGASVKEEALPADGTLWQSAKYLTRNIKHIILSNYIAENQEWPPFVKTPKPGTKLHEQFRLKVTNLHYSSYDPSDLDFIQFGKFLEFDYSTDYLKFLDDKAICPGASETPKFWFGRADQYEKRLLLKILTIPELDMVKLVERMRKGRTTREEEVIELTQKEREFKTSARCFAKLPIEPRCFFTLTEFNLGEGIMKKYFPQQTMTMSDTEQKQVLCEMGNLGRGKKKAIIEIDFSRWNLRWRKWTVNQVARVLEDCYGLPGVFSQAHEYFSRCTVTVTDSHNPPPGADPKKSIHEWPESDLLWRNHLGGFEGIQQKLWTICTIGMIYMGLEGTGCSFKLAGQGDNQVLLISIPEDKDMKQTVIQILAKLSVESFFLNHEVKPEECIDSAKVLTYSKNYLVDGVHIQYSLKFGSRMMSVMDSDVPSVPADIATACASAMMVANHLPRPITAVYLQNFHVLRNLRGIATLGRSGSQLKALQSIFSNMDLLEFALTLPGSLGGLPIASWGRYFMRGEVDELSWDVAATVRLSKYIPSLGSDLDLLLERKYTPISPNVEQLILDPSSIPIIRAKDARKIIKKTVSDQLSTIVKNRDIRPLVSAKVSRAGEQLLSVLGKMRPLYPLIAKDLYDASPAGVCEDLVSRFTMTRTISTVATSESFVSRIEASNTALLLQLSTRAMNAKRKIPQIRVPSDTYNICQTLRGFWGADILSVTMTTYCPLSCELTNRVVSLPSISASIRSDPTSLKRSVGKYSPNFGTKTMQKRSDHGFKIITTSDTVRILKSLTVTASELGSDPGLRQVIDSLISSRSPWNLEFLKNIFPRVYGGTAAHRHDSMNHQYFGILGNWTVPTHMSFDTDNAGQLVGGKEDYPVVFQEYFLTLTNIMQTVGDVLFNRDAFSMGCIIGHLNPLPSEQVTLDPSGIDEIEWPILKGNRLAYVDILQFREVNFRPPSHIIPPGEISDPVALVASFFLSSVKIKTNDAVNHTNGILSVKDMFDIAEYSGCDPKDFYLGASKYVAVEALYHATRSGFFTTKEDLIASLERAAGAISPAAARLALMRSSVDSSYLTNLGLNSVAGEGGAVGLSRKIQARLVLTAQRLISQYDELLTSRWYMFSDSPTSGIRLMRRLATVWILALSSAEIYSGRMRKGLKKQCDDSFNAGITGSSVDFQYQIHKTWMDLAFSLEEVEAADKIRRFRHYLEFCVKKGKRVPEPPKSLRHSEHVYRIAELYKQYYPNILYIPQDAKEALRWFRGKEPCSNIIQPIEQPSVTLPACRTLYSQNFTVLAATVPPDAFDRTKQHRREQVILTHIFRTVGAYASALSVWWPILHEYRSYISGTRTLSIGVGNGAVAVASLWAGATRVVGLDLRDSIPKAPHREVTWTPPELKTNGLADRFRWADAVFSVGGDWFSEYTRIELSEDLADCRTVIIDIESGFQSYDFARLWDSSFKDKLVFIRFFASNFEVSGVLSRIGRKADLYKTDYNSADNTRSSWILVLNHCPVISPIENYTAVDILSAPRFLPKIARSELVLVERLMHITAGLPVSWNNGTWHEIGGIIKYLRELKWENVSTASKAIAERAINRLQFIYYFRDFPEHDLIPSLVKSDLGTLENLRDLTLYLANRSLTPGHRLVERYLNKRDNDDEVANYEEQIRNEGNRWASEMDLFD